MSISVRPDGRSGPQKRSASDLIACFCGLSPEQRQVVIARSQIPPHLLTTGSAPPEVLAHELIQYFAARQALDELDSLIRTWR